MDGKHTELQDMEGKTLIPGVPDEISLERIVTKMTCRSLFVLAFVNRAWRRAVHGREVYNARTRNHSCQTLVAFSVNCHRQQGFYDLEQQWMCLLPPLPQSPGYIHTPVGAVMVDGKLFVLSDYSNWAYELGYGGTRRRGCVSKREVYMLDIGACRLSWKPCSSIKVDTGAYLSVACDDRIYAFSMFDKEVRGEVFDPKEDKWFRIEDQPLNVCPSFSYDGRLASLNKEIYVTSSGEKIMVFNCSTEKWREMKTTLQDKNGKKKTVSWLVIDEKLYNLSNSSVDVYDPASNTWALVQPICYENFKRDLGISPYPVIGARFGNEVLALLEHDISFPDGSSRKLYKSVGFGVDGCPMVWEVLPCSDLQKLLNTHNNFLLGSIDL